MLAVVHGHGEHIERYAKFARFFVQRGFAVYGFDLRGNGRSPGKRGHVDRWRQYHDDVEAFLEVVRGQERGAPVFLFGHSLGALVVLEFAITRPSGLAGVIASAPPFLPTGVESPRLEALARILTVVWPSFSVDLGLETAALTRDPIDLETRVNDPLSHRRISARLATEARRAILRTMDNAERLALPLLLMHGGADRVNDPQGSQAFFDRVAFPDKELLILPGGYHEPHTDIQHVEAAAAIKSWMKRHMKR